MNNIIIDLDADPQTIEIHNHHLKQNPVYHIDLVKMNIHHLIKDILDLARIYTGETISLEIKENNKFTEIDRWL